MHKVLMDMFRSEKEAFAKLTKHIKAHAEAMNKNCTKVFEYSGKLGILRPGIYRVVGASVDATVLAIVNLSNERLLAGTITIPTLVVLAQDDMIRITEDDGKTIISKYNNAKFVYSVINGRLLDYPRIIPAFNDKGDPEYPVAMADYAANIRMAAEQGYPVGSEYVRVVAEVSYGTNKVLVVDEDNTDRGEDNKCAGCVIKDIKDILGRLQ